MWWVGPVGNTLKGKTFVMEFSYEGERLLKVCFLCGLFMRVQYFDPHKSFVRCSNADESAFLQHLSSST